MTIKLDYKKIIIYIDNKVNDILSKGGSNQLLLSLLGDIMGDLKKVLDTATIEELELYSQKYKGFYCFMKGLEELALGISQGKFPPKYPKQSGMKKNPKKWILR